MHHNWRKAPVSIMLMWGKLLLRPHYNIKRRVSIRSDYVLPQTITGAPWLSNFRTEIIHQNIKNEHVNLFEDSGKHK
jgi:hypothetical protein